MQNEVSYLLENYKPNPEAIQAVSSTPIVLLVGISGAGKGTVRKLLSQTGDYTNFISYTTRQPRENDGVMEQNGVEYYFISIEKAVEMLKAGEFIEAKYYSGNIYGTTIAELLRAKESGKPAINDIEVQGINEYLAISSNVKVIFVVPPAYDTWIERLTARYDGDIDEDDLHLRLKTAQQELKTALASDRFLFVINDKLDQAVSDASNLIKLESQNDDAARAAAQDILRAIDTNPQILR